MICTVSSRRLHNCVESVAFSRRIVLTGGALFPLIKLWLKNGENFYCICPACRLVISLCLKNLKKITINLVIALKTDIFSSIKFQMESQPVWEINNLFVHVGWMAYTEFLLHIHSHFKVLLSLLT